MKDYDYELSRLPNQSLELARLLRQLRVDEETYSLMSQKLEETRIQEAGQKGIVKDLG